MHKFNYLLLITIIALTGCKPPKSVENKGQIVPSASMSLNSNFTNCEDKLRSYLKDQSFKFINVKRFDKEIKELNDNLGEEASSAMSFTELNKQITEYSHSTQYYKGTHFTNKRTMIGLNEKDSKNPMYFALLAESRADSKVIKIEQRFIISTQSAECQPVLSKTIMQNYTKINDLNYQFNSIEVAYDDSILVQESKDFKIEPGTVLSEFSEISKHANPTEEDLKNISTIVSFNSNMGVTKTITETLADSQDTIFGVQLNLKNLKVKVFDDKNNERITLNVGVDLNYNISVSKFSNTENWNGPFSKFFDSVYLGQAQSSSFKYYSSNLTSEYQSRYNTFVLKTIQSISYSNFKAYFSIIDQSIDSEQKTNYVLKENSVPVIESVTTALDLESNDTVQTELPEIKKIAAIIASTYKDNREGQIRAILEYLSTNYQYDHEMIDRNVVRPLTTREALDRKKGVCQHYAVLFTAIARALKIPARIVVGFHIMGERVGFHAWNEVEIKKNQWQVIEPQNRSSFDIMQTRYYFPLIRGIGFENKNYKSTKEIESIISGNFFSFEKYNEK